MDAEDFDLDDVRRGFAAQVRLADAARTAFPENPPFTFPPQGARRRRAASDSSLPEAVVESANILDAERDYAWVYDVFVFDELSAYLVWARTEGDESGAELFDLEGRHLLSAIVWLDMVEFVPSEALRNEWPLPPKGDLPNRSWHATGEIVEDPENFAPSNPRNDRLGECESSNRE